MNENSREPYIFDDPSPNKELLEIEPISLRAKALWIRSTSDLLKTNFIEITGACSMMAGMDYHFTQFLQHVHKIQRFDQNHDNKDHAAHEAIAWINRVGQFYYFCQSDFVKSRITNINIPTINSVIAFRHKHVSHRSIDKPKLESDREKFYQAASLSFHAGSFWMRRPGIDFSFPPEAHLAKTMHLIFKFPINNNSSWVELNIERDHSELVLECYTVLKSLLD